MIYLELFWAFLKVGLFSFGGGYGSIALIRDVITSYSWITNEMFTYFLAVSESTPGPIMVNLATYIGVVRAGFWGAVLATFAATLPAFLIILVVAPMMKAFLKNKTVAAIMRGIRPCIIGIILATGVWMMSQSIFPVTGSLSPDWIAIIIAVILGGVYYGYQAQFKHSFSPILLIVIAAGLGIVLYGL